MYIRRASRLEIHRSSREQFHQVHARLQVLLTRNEYSVFVMLWREEMKVKDIAAALGVTPRMVNNHKRSIEAKMKKEFNV